MGKELNSETGLYYFGARYYDPSLSVWLGVDKMSSKMPSWSPYAYCENNPILKFDPDGNYSIKAHQLGQYKKLEKYLSSGIDKLLKNSNIRDALKVIGNFTDDQINELGKFGGGDITIDIKQLDLVNNGTELNGNTVGRTIEIDIDLVTLFENAKTKDEENYALLGLVSTILHETTHVGLNSNIPEFTPKARNTSSGNFSRTFDPNADSRNGLYEYFFMGKSMGNSKESGDAFEQSLYWFGSPFGKTYTKQGSNNQMMYIYWWNKLFNPDALPENE